jgi:hypothetical protein
MIEKLRVRFTAEREGSAVGAALQRHAGGRETGIAAHGKPVRTEAFEF